MTGLVKVGLAERFGRANMVQMFTKISRDDLVVLQDLLEAVVITPAIDRSYPLADLPAALAYVGTGHARAKVVISI